MIEDAPVISDFNASCGIGITGAKDQLKQILKNVTLDLAIRHFYKEVKFFYILDDSYIEEFQWIPLAAECAEYTVGCPQYCM